MVIFTYYTAYAHSNDNIYLELPQSDLVSYVSNYDRDLIQVEASGNIICKLAT